MNKVSTSALFLTGVLLLVAGLNARGMIVSGVGEALTGAPSNHTLWLLVFGIAITAAGGSTLLRKN